MMEKQSQVLIKKAYAAFNARAIDTALSAMHPAIQWPKAFEGGYVSGHAEIREYWQRQWAEINPKVEPVEFKERQNGTLEISVHQVVKDLQGALLFDGLARILGQCTHFASLAPHLLFGEGAGVRRTQEQNPYTDPEFALVKHIYTLQAGLLQRMDIELF
ncbi:nuclear transport factor 2 family protein [Hymenobacter sp. BRD67]|uniref:nuclear transport factor 2 family protein n=1 Tax=Hymenobacter sp. BRD67 TaxID=2675877 RepID=UPI001598228B|nr:nuclear transport factor 2 family protein [Hymenobacter sp. BRD67]QKG52533.1 nuclear transport factor 2 family protein [Hymenobacter sp. BRD67]